jgi:hypothetical protein
LHKDPPALPPSSLPPLPSTSPFIPFSSSSSSSALISTHSSSIAAVQRASSVDTSPLGLLSRVAASSAVSSEPAQLARATPVPPSSTAVRAGVVVPPCSQNLASTYQFWKCYGCTSSPTMTFHLHMSYTYSTNKGHANATADGFGLLPSHRCMMLAINIPPSHYTT